MILNRTRTLTNLSGIPVMQVHDAASCSVLSAGRSSVDWKDRTDKFWTTKELKEIVDPV